MTQQDHDRRGYDSGEPYRPWGSEQDYRRDPQPSYHPEPPHRGYPQQGYDYPGWQQRPEPRNGLGLVSLILGLVGLVPGLVPLVWWLAAMVGITGLVLGLAALGRVRRGKATNRGVTYAGLGTSVLTIGLAIWGASIFFSTLNQLSDDLEDLGGGQLTAEEAAEGAANAFPAGQLVEVGDWRVAIQPANTNAATVIAQTNQFNEPPAVGTQFVMARADVAYVGAESGQPWLDLQFRILGGKGNTFDTGTSDCGVVPSPLTDIGEMLNGATAAGNVCIAVPVDQLEGAVWVVDQTLTDARAYIALQ